MTIIQFPASSRVEIDGGIIQSETVSDHNGTRQVFENVGSCRYFVDVVEADGTRIGMWDGEFHEDAVREAKYLSRDFGPIRDLSGRGAA